MKLKGIDAMAKTDVWMPIFIGDYLSATTHLTTAQHGAYMLLLMAAWKFEGRLPNDDEQLAAICKLGVDEWAKTKRLLIGFFSVSDSFWVQERLLAEYEKSQRTREARTASGSRGGRPKKQKETKTKPIGKPNGEAKQKQNETPSPSQYKYTSEDMFTAEFLFAGVKRLNPDHKAPNMEVWAESVRLMRERDSRTHDSIRSLFAWANNHKFWARNILSPEKLREKFDQLVIQRTQEPAVVPLNSERRGVVL